MLKINILCMCMYLDRYLPLTDCYCNTGDQLNMTTVTITRDQAIDWSSNPIPLPVLKLDVEKIVIDFPCKFKNTLNPKEYNVRPSKTSKVTIEVDYSCD